jgi:hypothetical protein
MRDQLRDYDLIYNGGDTNLRIMLRPRERNGLRHNIHFHETASSIPDDFVDATGHIYMNLHMEHYPNIINLFQNEDRIFVRFSNYRGYIVIDDEDVRD